MTSMFEDPTAAIARETENPTVADWVKFECAQIIIRVIYLTEVVIGFNATCEVRRPCDFLRLSSCHTFERDSCLGNDTNHIIMNLLIQP